MHSGKHIQDIAVHSAVSVGALLKQGLMCRTVEWQIFMLLFFYMYSDIMQNAKNCLQREIKTPSK